MLLSAARIIQVEKLRQIRTVGPSVGRPSSVPSGTNDQRGVIRLIEFLLIPHG